MLVRSGKKVFLSVLLVLAAASAAFAHKFVLAPGNFEVAVGEEKGVYGTFTEIIGTPEYSFSMTGTFYNPMDVNVEVVYNDESKTPIGNADFRPYDSKTNSVVPVEQSDCEYAPFTVTKAGTTVLHGNFRGTVDLSQFGGSGTAMSISHVKTFLNLAADGMAAKRLGGDQVLEVVFAEEVPADGLKEGSAVKFRFYHKGLPMKNASVFAAYSGAPSHTVMESGQEVQVNDYLEKITDENGEAVFLLDHAAAWFVGAFASEGSAEEYGGGLMFKVSEGEEEGDLTDFIIKKGANLAGIGFPTWVKGDFLDMVRDEWGLVNASNLVTAPNGSTGFLTGQRGQLSGAETGAAISIPLDVTRSGLKGMTGTEQALTLTADILGQGTYDRMAAFLKEERTNSPEKFFDFSGYGTWYVPYTPKLFFDGFGIVLLGKFSDGAVLNVGDNFQLGILYDEAQFDAGSIVILYGTMLVDSAPVDGAYWQDVTDIVSPENPNKMALVYDGADDGAIDFSYWLAARGENSGGGCSTGMGSWGIFGFLIGIAAFLNRGKFLVKRKFLAVLFGFAALFAFAGYAAGAEVNIYSARHYAVDDILYANFTKETGIQVNVINGNAPELVERVKREGERSPADLFMAVDGGVLNSAKLAGILQPLTSPAADEAAPARLRDKDSYWVGLTTRARVIVHSKERVKPEELSTYEDLASPKWKGRITVRSSAAMYDQSLLASLIALNGEEKAAQWARGIADNLARAPQGNDRDQAKAIAAGISDICIMNTYYIGQMLNSKDPEEVKAAQQVAVFFPNQQTTGTHLNVSGVGLVKGSPNKENAVKLVEFLLSPPSQKLLSESNYEYPANPGAEIAPLLKGWGTGFKTQELDFAVYGENNAKAIRIFNEAGWK
ncbi:MAG: extracellular solute-binding protein [Synergistaceae bacterium]|nr:extracellular solute-binding protein [Synergistaceae bacterium]